VGTVLTLGGWFLQASAFRVAPVTIVQPALAFTLVVVLLGAHRVLEEPVGVREVAAVGGLVAGLVLLIAAAPARTTNHADGARLAVPLLVLDVLAVAPLMVASGGDRDRCPKRWRLGSRLR
jgi:drug/metabolite transporter (DMT)-like permease